MTKEEALNLAWIIKTKYPDSTTAIISKLSDYNITVEDFNIYDSTMNNIKELSVEDPPVEERLTTGVPGFSQVDNMSDSEILRIYQAMDELESKLIDIGSPPIDAEWYTAGKAAPGKIAELLPFYETKKAEEEALMELPGTGGGMFDIPVKAITGTLMGGLAAIGQLAGGWEDMFTDFSEKQHETRDFPWIIPVEMYKSGVPGYASDVPGEGFGYTPGLLALEDELDQYYGQQREYKEKMRAGGWEDAFDVQQQIRSLNQIMMENKLQDPRLIGEIQ